jgi:phenylacetate-CoA ligase
MKQINWRKPVIYCLLTLSGSRVLKNLKEIMRIDALSAEERIAYQEEQLKKLLLHAYQNVPYYHDVLSDAGVVVDSVVHLENFAKIPVLTKEIIRREGSNLYSRDYQERGWYKNTSGGSTGEPVEFLQDREYSDWNIANKIFYKMSRGQDIGEREIRLWGSERDILEGREKFSVRLRNWLYNRKEFNVFRMSEADMECFVSVWNKFRPQWVEAYVQSAYEFAKFIETKRLSVTPPKGILTSAGTLYPDMERTMAEIFHCPVYNRYGSREVGDMACGDRSAKGLRLSIWNQRIEVLNERLEGSLSDEFGKIYVTTLHNNTMPLIRYDIGDIGIRGSDWNYLSKIEGREMSVLRTADGRIVPGEFFIHFIGVVFNTGSISKFQVIQEDLKTVRIKIIIRKREEFDKNMGKVEDSIKKVMGDIRIIWEEVLEIPVLKSGKYSYIISKL